MFGLFKKDDEGNAVEIELVRSDIAEVAVAKMCHEVNRLYCQSLGDNSQKSWESSPAWLQRSALNGVEHQIKNPHSPPSASHENWLADKEAAGWKYGPVKDVPNKLHPCCVPFDELPIDQQMKDRLFKAVCFAMLWE